MAKFTGVDVGVGSQQEIVDAIIALNRSLEYQMGHLDSENVMEIGGWRVGPTQLTSKDLDVGMSTDDSQAENIRFWAGNSALQSAPFRVYNTGKFVATDADITGDIHMTGGTISWGDVGAPGYGDITGPKPPTNADNTASNLLDALGSNFTIIGPTYIYSGTISADQIFGGSITSVTYNAFHPLTPNNKLMIRPSNIDGIPDLTFWSASSTTSPLGAIYLTNVGGQDFFSMFGPSGIQISSTDIWFNGPARFTGSVDFGSNVDFTGATVTGLEVDSTARFS